MFSDRLVSLRNAIGLTQEELSKRLGMARTTYQGYENGKREPDILTLRKIAIYYGITVDNLLGEDSKEPILSDIELSDDELIKKYNVVLDGRPIEESILREILSYVRVRRSTR